MTPPRSRWIACALALAGATGIVAATGSDGLALGGGWLVALAALAGTVHLLRPGPRRLVYAIGWPLLIVLCVGLVFEGGFFFIPAVFAWGWGELVPDGAASPLPRTRAPGG